MSDQMERLARSKAARELRILWVMFAHHWVRIITGWYTLKLLPRAPKGFQIVAVAYWHWLRDQESTDLIGDAQKGVVANVKKVGQRKGQSTPSASTVYKTRETHRKWRLVWSAAVFVALVVMFLSGRWAVDPLGLGGIGFVAVHVLGWIGRDTEKSFSGIDPTLGGLRIKHELLVEVFSRCGNTQLTRALEEDPKSLKVCDQRTIENGQQITVDLPANITAAKASTWSDQIASGLHLSTNQVFVQESSNLSDPANRVMIVILDRATSEIVHDRYELPDEFDAFGPLELGRTVDGKPFFMTLMFQSLVVIGTTGSGKSYTVVEILSHLIEDLRVQFIVADMKGVGDLGPMKDIALAYVSGDTDEQVYAMLDLLRWIDQEMADRKAKLDALPLDVCPERKITPQIASDPRFDMPPLVLVVDEFYALTAHPDKAVREEVADILGHISRQQRAVGMITIFAGHQADATDFNARLSRQFGARICLHVVDRATNDNVLGEGARKAGYDATRIGKGNPGYGFALDENGTPKRLHVHEITPQTFYERVARNRERRAQAGTLRGLAADSPQDVIEIVERTAGARGGLALLLDRVLAVWPVDKAGERVGSAPSSEIAKGLASRWAGDHGGLTAAELTRTLHGQSEIKSVSVPWGERSERRLKGYRLADVTEALNQLGGKSNA